MAMLEYDIRVNGANEAEQAIRGVDRAAQDTAGRLGDLDRRFDEAARGARGAAQGAERADEGFGKAERRAGALEGRLRGLVGGFNAVGAAMTAAMATVGASKLLELAEEGGGLQVISRNLEEIGVTADDVTETIGRLGGGSRSEVELLISRVDAMGVSFDQMGGLADAALQISIERGEDSHQIFNKLIRAIATGKQTYLQQLGITLDLKQAWDQYAESVGKTRSELTETEKAQVSSQLAIQELNKAFSGNAPDKYASNLGEVRDQFNNLADAIKRLAGDALSRLGAVLSGGLFQGNFASDNNGTRVQLLEKQIAKMEDATARLGAAARQGKDALTDSVMDLQEEFGTRRFADLLGLPSGGEVTRLTAAYIDAQAKIAKKLEVARDQLFDAQAEADYAAAMADAWDDAADEVETKSNGRRDDELAAEAEALDTRLRLARRFFERRAEAEAEANAKSAADAKAAREKAAEEERQRREQSARQAEFYRNLLDEQLDSAAIAVQALAGEIYASADAWSEWAEKGKAALAVAESAAQSIRVAFDAVSEAELTSRRNAVTLAQEQAAAAESAEERAAAEERAYEAQIALAEAEEQAAAARQVFQAIDYALEGGKMAAKSLEAAALASFLSALPFGAGAPFVPAAIAASVTYGAAATAYGVAGVATIASETPRSARPNRPDRDNRDTIEAGNRERGREGGGSLYVEFKGGALHSRTEVQEVILQSLDEHSRRRGRKTFDVERLDRRRGGR